MNSFPCNCYDLSDAFVWWSITIYVNDSNVQGTARNHSVAINICIYAQFVCAKVNGCVLVTLSCYRFSLIVGCRTLMTVCCDGPKTCPCEQSASTTAAKTIRRKLDSIVDFVQSLHLLNLVCRVFYMNIRWHLTHIYYCLMIKPVVQIVVETQQKISFENEI